MARSSHHRLAHHDSNKKHPILVKHGRSRGKPLSSFGGNFTAFVNQDSALGQLSTHTKRGRAKGPPSTYFGPTWSGPGGFGAVSSAIGPSFRIHKNVKHPSATKGRSSHRGHGTHVRVHTGGHGHKARHPHVTPLSGIGLQGISTPPNTAIAAVAVAPAPHRRPH